MKHVAIVFLALVLAACSKVPAGNVGIKVNLLGTSKGVDIEELGPGRYWIGMNEELYLFPTFTQNATWGNLSFQTVEGMKVTADVGISYSVVPDKVPTLFQKYRRGIDEITSVYLYNIVRDAIVTAASTKPIESVYGKGKEQLLAEALENARKKVSDIGLTVDSLYWAGDLRLPPQVTNALNEKIKATQMAQQRRNEVEQAKAEADKAIASARGEAESRLTLARAEAEAINIKGEALRANPQVLELNTIERWDGKLPYMMGGGAVPFVQVPQR